MNTVLEVTKHEKNDAWRVVTVADGDKQLRYIAFSAPLADALEKGKPLPDGTEFEPPKFDGALPSVRLPRKGGQGGTAFRNTKEGFLLEQEGRQRWQQVEEERRDRRTALMQAVQHWSAQRIGGDIDHMYLTLADKFYEWLRTSGSPSASDPPESSQAGDPEPIQGGGDATSPGGIRGRSPEPTSGTGAGETSGAGDSAKGKGGPPATVPGHKPGCPANRFSKQTKTGLDLPQGQERCEDCQAIVKVAA